VTQVSDASSAHTSVSNHVDEGDWKLDLATPSPRSSCSTAHFTCEGTRLSPQVLAAYAAAEAAAEEREAVGSAPFHVSDLLCIAKRVPHVAAHFAHAAATHAVAHVHATIKALGHHVNKVIQCMQECSHCFLFGCAAAMGASMTAVCLLERARLRSELQAMHLDLQLLHLKMNVLLWMR
jgi:hypothetical protein